jgi:hypothetical protein
MFQRLYRWTLSLAESRHAPWALGISMSQPSIVTKPELGSRNPVNNFMIVVLPAPL